jgi:hypothetical protein
MPRKQSAKKAAKSSVGEARNIPPSVKNRLIACSAGRCEFRGCNRDLFQHPVTANAGNFSQAAHIVAFNQDGARGKVKRPKQINSFENLMLLCGECHHLVDDVRPQDFPVSLLQTFKREHEERIAEVTAYGPEHRTTIIQLRGAIGGQPVDIPPTDIRTALMPRYPARLPGILIDLTAIQRESAAFFDLARDQIRRELRPAIRAELDAKHVQHYSVFALAPIPVLVALGRELGNKVVIDVFQRHRDNSWRWREDGPLAEYEFRRIREGKDNASIALQLSLSGRISPDSIPADITDRFFCYEIVLRGREPGVDFLNRREDLALFRKLYRASLQELVSKHGHFTELHLFAAVPAPVAVACGMDVMPKAHPSLVVYDNVKGAFKPGLTINSQEDFL